MSVFSYLSFEQLYKLLLQPLAGYKWQIPLAGKNRWSQIRTLPVTQFAESYDQTGL